jgi:hypothetical protein
MRSSLLAENSAHSVSRIVTGRLIEVTIGGFGSTADVVRHAQAVRLLLESHAQTQQLVLVADWRRCPLLPPEIASEVLAMMQRSSPLIARNALLHSTDQPTSVLQLFRVVQEAENPNRRVFTDPSELRTWLDDLLDATERERLTVFLSSPFGQQGGGP